MSPRLTIFIIAFALLFTFARPAEALCSFHQIAGWIWSSNLGWISLNCNNTCNGDACLSAVDYGMELDFNAPSPTPITGYGWSANAGWLDFEPDGPYPGLPNNDALFTRNAGAAPTSTAGVITGWAQFAALGEDGWVKLGPITLDGEEYGVKISTSRAFSLWSYNGGDVLDPDDPPAREGFGWVSWTSGAGGAGGGYGAVALYRWFETLYGDIYGGVNLDSAFGPSTGRYSATYLLQANNTIDPLTITSSLGTGPPYRAENFGVLSMPKAANNYRGTLGALDRQGLINGNYGAVTTYPGNRNSSATLGSSLALDGKVYYYPNNLTVNSALAFNRGDGITTKGNGTIIVDGNLIIDADIAYQTGPVASRIDDLPSVAWLVKGDITVAPAVSSVAGVFLSEGAVGFSTGTTGESSTDTQLVVSGAVIAKRINLQRLWLRASDEPAEQFIFDGRAVASPPPGLADMIKGLPTLREVTP